MELRLYGDYGWQRPKTGAMLVSDLPSIALFGQRVCQFRHAGDWNPEPTSTYAKLNFATNCSRFAMRSARRLSMTDYNFVVALWRTKAAESAA
jgi:hypothetical protein